MANLIKTNVGTTVSFLNTGGDALFDFSSTASGAGEGSARLDLGAYPRGTMYRWYAETQMQATTPVVGQTVDIFLGLYDDESTPGRAWGDLTTVTNYSSVASWNFATENDLRNLYPVGNIVCDTVAADTKFTTGGLIFIPTRYITLIWWNRMGATSTADATEHKFYLTPMLDEIQ